MKTILILGATGMLGSAVGKYFQEKSDYDTYLTTRKSELIYGKKANWINYDPSGEKLTALHDIKEVAHSMPRNPDFILNCIGVIKPFIQDNPGLSIYINSLYPHVLAEYCEANGIKLIHITTDCVFSGAKGNYTEKDPHDCLDSYGKTKSLGEPGNCMVIRTSIIGPEIHKNASLVAWAQSQKGGKVKGFTNHFWNGLATKTYADVCHQIMDKGLFEKGLFHVYSNKVSKRELVKMLNKRYDLGLEIEPVEANEFCDRSMLSTKELIKKLDIPELEKQIINL